MLVSIRKGGRVQHLTTATKPGATKANTTCEGTVASACERLALLANPTRLKIVLELATGPCCVCVLTERLGLSQPSVSHALSELKNAGLLRKRRIKSKHYYSLAEVFAEHTDSAGEPSSLTLGLTDDVSMRIVRGNSRELEPPSK